MKPLHIYPEALIPLLRLMNAPDELVQAVAKWVGKGTRMVVSIKPEATRLSDRQRDYYWAAVVPSFIAWYKDQQGAVHSPARMDDLLRLETGFYTLENIALPNGKFRTLVEVKSISKSEGVAVQEMARFLDDCNSLHVEWFGCEMPPPREPLV